MNRARLRILTEAASEAFLWDVRLPGRDYLIDDTIRIRPAIPVEELRPELAVLLREGLVVLTRAADPAGPPAPLDLALTVIADERNWYSPLALGLDEARDPVEIYCVALTNDRYSEFQGT